MILQLLTLTLSALAISFSPDIRCADGSILPTPSYSQDHGIFSVCTESIVNAPLAEVRSAVLDFPRYPSWNEFVTSVDFPSNVSGPADVYIGMPMTFHTEGLLPFNTTSNEVISILDQQVIAWDFDDSVGGSFVQAQHPYLFTDLANGSVRVVSYETYYKLGSVVISSLLKSNLQKQFDIQAKDLKKFVERGGR